MSVRTNVRRIYLFFAVIGQIVCDNELNITLSSALGSLITTVLLSLNNKKENYRFVQLRHVDNSTIEFMYKSPPILKIKRPFRLACNRWCPFLFSGLHAPYPAAWWQQHCCTKIGHLSWLTSRDRNHLLPRYAAHGLLLDPEHQLSCSRGCRNRYQRGLGIQRKPRNW